MTTPIDSIAQLPGLRSVATTSATPASMSRRAFAGGMRHENVVPGSSDAHRVRGRERARPPRRRRRSGGRRRARPSSTASSAAPDGANSSACSRGFMPASRAASEHAPRLRPAVYTPFSQKTSAYSASPLRDRRDHLVDAAGGRSRRDRPRTRAGTRARRGTWTRSRRGGRRPRARARAAASARAPWRGRSRSCTRAVVVPCSEQRSSRRRATRHELVLGRLARAPHRRADAAARRRDLQVALARRGASRTRRGASRRTRGACASRRSPGTTVPPRASMRGRARRDGRPRRRAPSAGPTQTIVLARRRHRAAARCAPISRRSAPRRGPAEPGPLHREQLGRVPDDEDGGRRARVIGP